MTQILDHLVRIVRFRCKDVVGNTKDGVLWIQYFRIETDAKQLFISKLRNQMIADRFFEDSDNYELRMMAGSRNWGRVKHLVNTLDGTGNDTVRSRGSREETEDGSHYDKEIIRSRVRADCYLESMPDSPKRSILTGKAPMHQN